MSDKQCIQCREVKDLSKFELDKIENDTKYYRPRCRICYNEMTRERKQQMNKLRNERARNQYLEDIRNL
jgi:hypothetical protein